MSCLIYATFDHKDEARRIARYLIKNRLVACVNIMPSVESIYFWNNKVKAEEEVIFIAKTVKKNIDVVVDKIKSLHSNECPCILACDIIGGEKKFLKWIETFVNPAINNNYS